MPASARLPKGLFVGSMLKSESRRSRMGRAVACGEPREHWEVGMADEKIDVEMQDTGEFLASIHSASATFFLCPRVRVSVRGFA